MAFIHQYQLTQQQRDEALASAEGVRETLLAEKDKRAADREAAARDARDPNERTLGDRLLAVFFVGLLMLIAFIGGRVDLGNRIADASQSATAVAMPGEHSAEAGFARDMQIHHAQAVDMAMRIRDLSADPAIRTLGYDIALTQQEQIGEMHGWLSAWGLPQTGTDPIMSWMHTGHDMSGHDMSGHATSGMDTGHEATATLMPGMATADDLDHLDSLTGTDAEILFLHLMIRHHQAGVDMAEAIVSRTEQTEVTTLAQTMINTQQAEIDQMTQMLTARGATP